MSDKTFIIVVRERDFQPFERRNGRDAWGWEPVDGIEMDYKEAKKMLAEYLIAMPNHTVRMRSIA